MTTTAQLDIRRWPKTHREAVRALCEQGWTARPASSGALTMTPPDGSASHRVSDKTDLKELASWQRRVARGSSDLAVIDLTTQPEEPAEVTTRPRKSTEPPYDVTVKGNARPETAEEQADFMQALLVKGAESLGWSEADAVLLGYVAAGVTIWRNERERIESKGDSEAQQLAKLYEGERDTALREREALQSALDREHTNAEKLQGRAREAERERDAQRARADTAEGKLQQLRSALDL